MTSPSSGWSKPLAANPQVAPPYSSAGGRRQRRRQEEWVVGGEIPLLVGGGSLLQARCLCHRGEGRPIMDFIAQAGSSDCPEDAVVGNQGWADF